MPVGERAGGGMLEVSLDARRGGFHLEVACGLAAEWTVIFGPSGAGKSTLLRMLAGLDRLESGRPGRVRIVLDGERLADSSKREWLQPGRRRIALVAQQPALFPHLSVTANVEYGLSGLDRRSRGERVEEMLALVEAAPLALRRVQNLSGGEAQRVALARALATRPRLLLLDEPFSAMDGAASDALLERMQAWLTAHKVQTILATHDATDAFATDAEVVLLREGRLAAQGPARAVLAVERERLRGRLEESARDAEIRG
jgi:ABC-type sulfate/molybdate transport systems ATPase subunit